MVWSDKIAVSNMVQIVIIEIKTANQTGSNFLFRKLINFFDQEMKCLAKNRFNTAIFVQTRKPLPILLKIFWSNFIFD